MVIVVAHRGFRVGVPENTIQAFSLAVTLGVDYIELDVQLSADGEAFVLHDPTLARTMGVDARMGDMTAAQVDEINSSRGDAGIPRLSDVLGRFMDSWAPRSPTGLMLELKGAGTGEVVPPIILARGIEGSVVFSGRDLHELRVAHGKAPDVPICLNITSCKEFTKRQLLKARSGADLPLPLAMVSLRARQVDHAFIRACHSLGASSLAWDFLGERRPAVKMARLLRLGLDGVLLDDPRTVELARTARPS